MACRNNYLITIFIFVLIYFIVIIPLEFENEELEEEHHKKEHHKKEYFTQERTYGGTKLVYEDQPNEYDFYYPHMDDDIMKIRDSNSFNDLDKYHTVFIPEELNMSVGNSVLTQIDNDLNFDLLPHQKLANMTDSYMDREIRYQTDYDGYKIRYGMDTDHLDQ